MTGKENLELVLDGQIPDSPPHWELVFQIEKAMFGMDRDTVAEAGRPALCIGTWALVRANGR